MGTKGAPKSMGIRTVVRIKILRAIAKRVIAIERSSMFFERALFDIG